MTRLRVRAVYILTVWAGGFAAGCGGGSSTQDVNNPITGTASFAQNIQPIFTATCATSGCHSGASASFAGNLDLSAGLSYGQLVGQPTSAGCAAQVPNVVRVVPGDTMGSMLWRKVAADPSRCFQPMPFGTSGLIHVARNDFDAIEKWIQQGALNN